MEFILGLFRFALVVDCVLLVLLVLIQLPKKDAGLGVAFGGAATDALFGAGAGNAITKITKWATVSKQLPIINSPIIQPHLFNNYYR